MTVFVKVCGLKTAADVAAAAAAGADAIGFVFAESVRRVTPAEATLACSGLGGRLKRVAVMKQPSQSLVDEVIREFAPDVLQTDAADLAALVVPQGLEIWPVFRQGASRPVDEETFLYEGPLSGSGSTIDWAEARKQNRAGRMILAGGLDADNVATAIRDAAPFGVDVSSGVESEPGRKDHDRINAFLKAAKAVEIRI